MIKVEQHFWALFKASQSACELLDLLPDCDLVDELKNILNIQFDVFIHMFEGKHYGIRDLNNFLAYSDEINEEAARLREEI